MMKRTLFGAVILLLLGALVSGGPAQATAPSGEIQSVSVSASHIVIRGAATQAATINIYALDPSQDPTAYSGQSPVASAAPGHGTFRVEFARRAGAVDRYYDKFVAVVDDSVLGAPHYVDHVDFAAPNTSPYPKTTTIKGLSQVDMTDDADALGVQHAGVNVALNALMRKVPGDPGTYISFSSNGNTYYFDKAQVESLDKQIKPLSDDGIVVNFILILYPDSNPNSAFSILVHPDAQLGAGSVYAFNTKTAQGIAYYTAAIEFLASRYSRSDQKYGRALDYVVGNEVDAAWIWAQMGDQSLADFTEYYGRALRITWLAARKYYQQPRVYVSLEHAWAESPDPSKPLQAYAGKDLLNELATVEKSQGDFPWNVAYHPYPQDLPNPRVWDDTQAVDSADSPLITFKNVQVLPQYLRQPQLTFGGKQRHIILSEQGCNTPSASLADQQLQAACYAYAYYKILFAGGIDAFNVHRHVDHPLEGGLRLGLWSWDPAKPTVNGSNMPGDPKYVYNVAKYIDTSKSLQVTDFAKKIIGITDWKDVIPNFDPAKLDREALPTELPTSPAGVVRNPHTIADFEHGSTDGWRAADNASSVEAVTGALRVHFDTGLSPVATDAKVWKGADARFKQPLDATTRSQLVLSVRIPPPAPGQFQTGITFQTQVRVYSTDGTVGYGIATIDPANGWNRVAVDLRGWSGAKTIDRIKVWVRGSTDDDWPGTFDLDNVQLARR